MNILDLKCKREHIYAITKKGAQDLIIQVILYWQKECHARSAEKDLLSLIFGTRVMNLRCVATLNGFLRMQTDAYFSIFNDLTAIIQPLFLSFLNYAQLLQNATLT